MSAEPDNRPHAAKVPRCTMVAATSDWKYPADRAEDFEKLAETLEMELESLRESVRRIVEKWTEAASKHEDSFRRTGSSTSGLLSDLYESNAKELSALIDGKEDQP